MDKMNLGVSVIICCYNSAWVIERCLEALKKQQTRESLCWEIVLVDNNSADGTLLLAQQVMADSQIHFVPVTEQRQGLAFAREKGVATAQYCYLLYCDDDNLLSPNYIDKAFEMLSSSDLIGAVGGKGIAEFEVEPENEVLENLDCYAIGSQLNHKDWLYGAGLVVRADLVRKIYTTQTCYLVGRKGNELLSGDDTELVMSIALRGYQVIPTDEISFIHVLKANRLTNNYYYNLLKGLRRPAPVIEVMQAVLDGQSMEKIEKRYRGIIKTLIRTYLFFWRKDMQNLRRIKLEQKAQYDFWGMKLLRQIHREWNVIKKTAVQKNSCI